MKPLDGLVVIEFSQFLSGSSAALRLADMGARVIMIEHLGIRYGDQASIVNRNKESYAVNLNNPEELTKVKKLIEQSNVIIDNYQMGLLEKLGLGYESVKKINPDIVYGSITGYGKAGPWVGKSGQDILVQSLTGATWLNGDQDDSPVTFGLPISDLFAGAHLVQGILACLVRAGRTGKGGLVEVSLLESLLDFQFEVLTTYLNDGGQLPIRSSVRNAHAYLAAPYGIYETLDGYIALAMGSVVRLGQLIGCQEVMLFTNPKQWFTHRDEIKGYLQNHLKKNTTEHWLSMLESSDYWCADVFNWDKLLLHDGFKALHMIQEIGRPGEKPLRTTRCPIRMNGERLTSSRWVPTVGEHNLKIDNEINLRISSSSIGQRVWGKEAKHASLDKPLKGITIVDFSQFLSGPSASLRMADLGARVIKVERPDIGDICRTLYISNLELDGDSTLFHSINRNKESFAADLKESKAFENIIQLIQKADILIQNFRPDVMERLGLHYEAVKKINPRMIYGEITGYGTEGPWKEKPGQDLLVQSLSGVTWLDRSHMNMNSSPSALGLAAADMFTGAHLVQGILAGLLSRSITGNGCHVEVSLLESILDIQFEKLTSHLNQEDIASVRSTGNGVEDDYKPLYGIYETADGYIALAIDNVKELSDLLACPSLGYYMNEKPCEGQTDRINDILAEHLKSKTVKEWMAILQSVAYCCAEVLNWNQMIQHDGFKALDMIQEVRRTNGVSLQTTRCPIRVDGQLFFSPQGSPIIGEHNTKILREFNEN